MWRGAMLAVGVVGACVGLMVVSGQASPPPATPTESERAFKPVAPISSLMYAQDMHFERIHSLLVDEHETDRAIKIRHEAMTLAELANVNRLHKDKNDYRHWADEVKAFAMELGTAAANGDFVTAKNLYKQINTSCTACHKKYQ